MKKLTGLMAMMIFALLFTKPTLAASDYENKEILKDAITGAVTGAVATEATKDGKNEAQPSPSPSSEDPKDKGKKHHQYDGHKGKFVKDKKHPHGWDQGKKTGWGGGDEPPGLSKKHDR